MSSHDATPETPRDDLTDDERTMLLRFRAAIVEPDDQWHNRPVNVRGTIVLTLDEFKSEARQSLRTRGLLWVLPVNNDVYQCQLSDEGKRVALALPTPLPRP